MPADYRNNGSPLSILDRLTDLQPEERSEAPTSSWHQAREVRASLCRDLTALLNTRRAEEEFDPEFIQATNSLLSYGMVDFAFYNLRTSVARERVRRSIERAIRQFEPRLAQVTVTVDEPDPLAPALGVHIIASLRAEQDGEMLLFHAGLYRDSGRIEVSGAVS